MRLKTLGGLALEGTGFTRPKPLLLLTYLALEGGKERRFLSELLWMNAANPRNSLAMALSRLKRNAPEVVQADDSRAWAVVECDAVALLTALERNELEDALEAYEGAFLLGVNLGRSGVEFEEWAVGTREFIANRVRAALLELAEAAAGRGEFGEAARLAERAYLLAEAGEPEVEELGRIHTLLVAGEHPRATEVRKEAASIGITLEADRDAAREESSRRTSDEPRTEPGPLEIGTSFVGRNAELLELTELLSQEGIRLLTIAGPGGVGKTRLAVQLAHRLRGRFPGGVHFVPLEAVTNPAMILGSIASRLGVMLPDGGDRLAQLVRFVGDERVLVVLDNFEHLLDGATLTLELLRACPNLRILVTSRVRLSLVEEAVFPLEGLVSPVRFESPPLEVRYRDAIELFAQRAKSANLRFSLTPDVVPEVIRICELVGASPLGIELAATWVRVMPPTDIAREIGRSLDFLESPLRNTIERQRSLREVFEHSWNLLLPREQEVSRKLSVFRGGFRREAAAVVTGVSIPMLARLVDKSFLRVLPSGRYDRHPLVFAFTVEKLAQHPDEESEVGERLARHVLEWVEGGEEKFRTAEEKAWLDRLDEEIDNIRAALRWMNEAGEIELGLRLCSAVQWYWRVRGHVQEGLASLRACLALPAGRARTAARAKALITEVLLIGRVGDYAAGLPLGEESVSIWRESRNERALAFALMVHGNTLHRLGDSAAARPLLEEAVERARAAGDTQNLPQILGGLASFLFQLGEQDLARRYRDEGMAIARASGNTYVLIRGLTIGHGLRDVEAGEYDSARMHFEESLELSRSVGDKESIPVILAHKGKLSCRVSDYPEARSLCEESLDLSTELGNLQARSTALNVLGDVLLAQGEVGGARARYQESYAICRDMSWEKGVTEALIELGRVDLVTGGLGEARARFEEGLTRAQGSGYKIHTAEALHGLGGVALAERDLAGARSRFEESLAIMRKLGNKRGGASALLGLGDVAGEMGDPPTASAHYGASLEIQLGLGNRHGVAQVLERFARLSCRAEPLRAVRLWGAAESIREAIGAALLPEERDRHDRDVAEVRERSTEAAFSAAWAQGRKMPPAEAAAFALDRSSAGNGG